MAKDAQVLQLRGVMITKSIKFNTASNICVACPMDESRGRGRRRYHVTDIGGMGKFTVQPERGVLCNQNEVASALGY